MQSKSEQRRQHEGDAQGAMQRDPIGVVQKAPQVRWHAHGRRESDSSAGLRAHQGMQPLDASDVPLRKWPGFPERRPLPAIVTSPSLRSNQARAQGASPALLAPCRLFAGMVTRSFRLKPAEGVDDEE